MTNEIDRILHDACESGAIPGIVAMVATPDAVTYRGAFGKRDIAKPAAMTENSVFWIASMTKAITGAAAMQLVEQGRLSLDGPISRILPDLAAMPVMEGFSADGTPKLRPVRGDITLRQLLTHTAGFCYEHWNPDMVKYVQVTGTPSFRSGLLAALKAPLARDPGTRWEYSTSIDFVGRAVEEASGMSLERYFREYLTGPLGMTDTGFLIGDERRQRLVTVHRRGDDGSLTPTSFEIKQDPEFLAGGGGLYGTAADYIRFTQMILNGGTGNGNRVLKPETVALMGQNHIGDLNVMPLPAAVPAISNAVDLYPGMDKKWGLSFMINTESTPEGRSAGSLAWAGLANTYYWIDPVRAVTGVIMMQVLPFADATCLKVFSDFERAVYAGLGENKAA